MILLPMHKNSAKEMKNLVFFFLLFNINMTDLRHCSVYFMLQYKTYLSKAYAGSRIPPKSYI